MALSDNTAAGELVINGVSMHTPAWRVKNQGILLFPPELRGEYVVIPGVDGETATPQRWQAGRYPLEFQMVGDVDHTGAPFTNKQEGFVSNMNYLATHVLTGPTLTGNRTRTATFQAPGEETPRTAEVHVDLRPGLLTTNYWTDMILEVRVPAGMFE